MAGCLCLELTFNFSYKLSFTYGSQNIHINYCFFKWKGFFFFFLLCTSGRQSNVDRVFLLRSFKLKTANQKDCGYEMNGSGLNLASRMVDGGWIYWQGSQDNGITSEAHDSPISGPLELKYRWALKSQFPSLYSEMNFIQD